MKPAPSPSTPRAWWRSSAPAFSLVEAMLAAATFVGFVTAFVGAMLYGQEASMLAGNRVRALLLAEEGLQAAQSIRDAGYANLVDGTFGLATTGGQWNLTGSSDTSDIFTRQVNVATVDSKRKAVTSTVTWQQNPQRTGTVAVVTRLTNWIARGVVFGDWSLPQQESSLDLATNIDGVAVQIKGNFAYVVRNDSVPDFLVVDISTPSSPAVVGSLTLSGAPTNIFVSGNFAYVTTNSLGSQLQIVNITTPSAPTFAGAWGILLAGSANGVFVSGATAYVTFVSTTLSTEFSVVNVANPAAAVTLGSLELGATGDEVVVSGTTAYVASTADARELTVINVATPSAPALLGAGLNFAGTTDAISVAISGSTLYITQGAILRIVNVATPASPALLGGISLANTINDIALDLGNSTVVYLGTGISTNEFQAINVTNPAAPVVLGQFNVSGSSPLLGIAYSADLDRVVAVGQSNTGEFVIIKPQ